jgi:hypothetical protein
MVLQESKMQVVELYRELSLVWSSSFTTKTQYSIETITQEDSSNAYDWMEELLVRIQHKE